MKHKLQFSDRSMVDSAFLLSRILLRFDQSSPDLIGNISAAAISPDGSLWTGSDELNTIERLSPLDPFVYGNQKSFAIADFLSLDQQGGEIDIEGMDYSPHYLWIAGSHSTKRKRPKGKNAVKDIRRLKEVATEPNRYLLGRIPIQNGNLLKSCPHPQKSDQALTAACLQRHQDTNVLIEALKEDVHLGDFVANTLPSKENGFDIEGLAVYRNRLFLGLRGPVLRGWAIILEIEVAETEPGILTLQPFRQTGQRYKKHFVDLDGLGIRDLCFHDDHLLILAGPTMDLAGATRLFQLKYALSQENDSLSCQGDGRLDALLDLPFHPTADKAEGLTLFPCFGKSEAFMVLYDSPQSTRMLEPGAILVDVFKL
ncbi:MAG TPA: DUF3616 domain-containing protein [Crinalium sp.]|jgi:hypothetical protein